MGRRRLAIGAELQEHGGAHFRVWAPARERVDVVVEGRAHALAREPDGHFSGFVGDARAGATYRYRLDGAREVPDPASRFQPDGPHGASAIVDPGSYRWRDTGWRGVTARGQVICEVHVGTLTPEGTYAAAAGELARLRDLGVTLIELMPVNEFPGAFGWGYDGVGWFAPFHGYGTPEDLRRFVDEAHALGLGVLLDVVYNHYGPDGCYLRDLSPTYFSQRHANEWGDALNFDDEGSLGMRELAIENAGYWIDELHFDGLRLDATQTLHDDSGDHVIRAIARRARAAAGERAVLLVAENEAQQAALVRPEDRGGFGLDAVWNDDFHHAAVAATTGRREAYYVDTKGTPQELVSAIKRGYLFQGQRYDWQKKARGSFALDVPAHAFVHYVENHDQVANSARGARLASRTSPGRYRALMALLLLGPETPMLFQGQEYGATTPFVFFADHRGELADAVRKGRADFLAQFPSEARDVIPDPCARATFERCKLDPAERERQAPAAAMVRDLLRLRRDDAAFARQSTDAVDGAVIAHEALVVRFFCERGDRLLVVNLGPDLVCRSIAEPLLAPPRGEHWRTIWSSEDPRYGGDGAGVVDGPEGWRIGRHQAAVLAPEETS
jgi:maltooligosyltrehalose trehalohydrolase